MNKLEECARAIKAKVPLGYGMTLDEAREYARAVIRCLMEPSEEAVKLGLKYLPCYDPDPSDAKDCYVEMLQSVLDEAGKE